MRPVRYIVSVAAAALGALSLVTAAFGDAPKPTTKGGDAGERFDPDNVTALSQYMKTLLDGNERYAAKDWAGAVDTYRKAILLNPKSPLGHYLLGEAQLAAGNTVEAEAAFLAAQDVSDSKNPILRSHVLFAVADVYERQKKWEQAQKAWQVYTEHAGRLAGGGAHSASGVERLKVMDRILALEKSSAAVRERIAAEKDAGPDARR